MEKQAMKFKLINVFTHKNKNGNQLAVVFCDDFPSEEKMQELTLNFGYSETVFIKDLYDVRIFSPAGEYPFAGHPTIGSAWAISQERGSENFEMRVPLGIIPCSVKDLRAQIQFPGKVQLSPYAGSIDELLACTHLKPQDVNAKDIMAAHAGPNFVILPVNSHEALKNAKSPMTLPTKDKAYLVYRESPGVFYVRMFSPALAPREDAATGSAACALAGYLYQHLSEEQGQLTVYQGSEINRSCEIQISWDKNKILLSGSTFCWAEGISGEALRKK